MASNNIDNLEELLQAVRDSYREQSEVSVQDVMQQIHSRSFGPFWLLVGVIYATPVVGDIPGVPIVLGVLLILVSAQLLVGSRHLWLPKWLLHQSVSARKMNATLDYLCKPAHYIDTVIKSRLKLFTNSTVTNLIALVVIMIALLSPAMAVVPLSANVAGVALICFGLGVVANDGFFNLLGLLIVLSLGLMLGHAFFW